MKNNSVQTAFKRLGNILVFALLFLWQLPQNLVAIGILLYGRSIRLVCYRNFCLGLSVRLPQNAAGVSLGNFAIISPDCIHDPIILRHEMDGHTVDSKIFGPLYLPVIGIPSLLHLFHYNRKRPKNKSYYDFYTERRANRHAGIH